MNYLQKPLRLDELTHELERFRSRAGEPQTVLVVDDDPAIPGMHTRLIEQTGRRVLAARNGREAPAGVELVRRTNGTQTWLFALNYSSEPVRLPLAKPGVEVLSGTLLDGACHLGPLGVAIIRQ